MLCYYVLVHGKLNWRLKKPAGDDVGAKQPSGFYCHRYLLAADEHDAAVRALRRVRDNLDRETGWLSGGAARVDLEVEEISIMPIRKVLKPDNKGHSFYLDE